jgi:hypothetical protein
MSKWGLQGGYSITTSIKDHWNRAAAVCRVPIISLLEAIAANREKIVHGFGWLCLNVWAAVMFGLAIVPWAGVPMITGIRLTQSCI